MTDKDQPSVDLIESLLRDVRTLTTQLTDARQKLAECEAKKEKP